MRLPLMRFPLMRLLLMRFPLMRLLLMRINNKFYGYKSC
jgi:hypothetical protein